MNGMMDAAGAGPPGYPPPIPGVSQPASPPEDPMATLAGLLGKVKGDRSASAITLMVEAMRKLKEAAEADPRIAPIVEKMLAVPSQGVGPPGGMPPQGGLLGPVGMPMPPPGIGMMGQ